MAKEPTTSENNPEGGGKDPSKPSKSRVRTGVAIGIGSAAIVAALLYANRGRRGDRNES
jgi:hypothetical protein